MPPPSHSLQKYRCLPCSQMAEPSHCLQVDRCMPCSQIPPPLHCLQVYRCLPCSQKPAPLHSLHLYRCLPCSQNNLGLQMAQLHLNLPCKHFLRILPIFLTISQSYDRSSLCSISFFIFYITLLVINYFAVLDFHIPITSITGRHTASTSRCATAAPTLPCSRRTVQRGNSAVFLRSTT